MKNFPNRIISYERCSSWNIASNCDSNIPCVRDTRQRVDPWWVYWYYLVCKRGREIDGWTENCYCEGIVWGLWNFLKLDLYNWTANMRLQGWSNSKSCSRDCSVSIKRSRESCTSWIRSQVHNLYLIQYKSIRVYCRLRQKFCSWPSIK